METNRSKWNHTGWLLCLLIPASLLGQADGRRETQIHYRRAQQALESNQPDVAASEFREMLRLDPNNAQVYGNLGVIAFEQRDYRKAADAFRAALRLQPTLWNAQAFLGMCEMHLGHARAAEELIEKSFPHLEDARLRSQAGRDLIQIYYEQRNLGRIVDVLRALEPVSPNDPEILYAAYRAYTDLAAHSLASLARIAPESARMHQVLGQTLMNQDNFAGAIVQYRRALEIDPHLPGLHFELGQAILASSQTEPTLEQAKKEFQAELAADPSNANAQYSLGEIHWLQSNRQAAREQYSAALKLRPDFVDAQIALGKVLTAVGQSEQALVHLLEAVKLDPKNDVAHYRLALVYRKLGRKQEADREWDSFQRLRNSQATVRSLYRQVLERPPATQTIEPGEP